MTWQQLCNLEDLTDKAGQEFVVDGQVIAVFRQGDHLYAVDGMCAHQGGPLAQGQLDQQCVTCPWHGWQYDITNGQNTLTGKKMLTTFPAELRGDAVWIELP